MEGKIMPIVGYGSPILREVCKEVENNVETMLTTISLLQTMSSIGTAVGLAAPQINANTRIFAMRLNGKQIIVINPVIKKRRGTQKYDEGCLSIPGLNGIVPDRDEIIDVEFFDAEFKEHKMRLRGFDAVVFQHEFDHLNGVLYIDRMTKEGREAVNDKLSDIEKGIHKAPFEMVFTHLL
jgi:peptide deformylase